MLSRKQLIVVGVGVALGLGIAGLFLFGGQKKKLPEVNLTVWGTLPSGSFEGLAQAYKGIRPNVKVVYVQLPAAGYKERILEALAAGTGPDVFMVQSRGLLAQKNKLTPVAPALFSLTKLRQLFPTVVEEDFVSDGSIYALPLSIDTLALFYNKDLLDRAAIAAPPGTWSEFMEDAQKLRLMDDRGGIARAGVALGGSARTVAFAPDILQLLMFQNGVPFVGTNGADFASREGGGVNALNFYLQFADTGSAAYTWNEIMPQSREAFAAGKAAMIFDYHSAAGVIRAQSPYLRFGTAPVPQLREGGEGAIAFARYAGFAVSRQSRVPDWGWDFVLQVATNPALAEAYRAVSGEPPALRSLIAGLVGDPGLDVFARQALLARSWPSPDGERVDAILNDAIVSVLSGQAETYAALGRAEGQVTQLLQNR